LQCEEDVARKGGITNREDFTMVVASPDRGPQHGGPTNPCHLSTQASATAFPGGWLLPLVLVLFPRKVTRHSVLSVIF
jgi:hypothetical protein